MQRGFFVAGLLFLGGISYAQTLGEANAAVNANNTLDGGSVTGGLDSARLQGNARAAAAAAGGNPAPFPGPPPAPSLPALGAAPVGGGPALTSYPGLAAPPVYTGQPGVGQPGAQATPTPVPTIKVLVGKRVFCAVCGNLLEDAVQLTVPQTEQDKYVDDGIHDNGIAGDGIRGNVDTIKDKYIGAECNSIKNRLINVVRHAEDLDPMHFFGYHVMELDPLNAHADMPKVLEKEQQRDDVLRDWNNKFLADYRVDKKDPKSEFYQLYVPEPPQPPKYPVPPGYVAPQKLAAGGAAPGGQIGATPRPNIYNGDSEFGGKAGFGANGK